MTFQYSFYNYVCKETLLQFFNALKYIFSQVCYSHYIKLFWYQPFLLVELSA